MIAASVSSSTTAISPIPPASCACCRTSHPREVYNLGAQSHVRGELRPTRIHRRRGGHRNLATSRSDPQPTGPVRAADPVLSGLEFGDVRQGPRSPAARDHAVPSAVTLRLRQGVRSLDDRELPRELRHARLVRHPLQSREPQTRRDLRHPEDHPRGRSHQARTPETSSSSAISMPCATGASPATTSKRCG